LAANIVRSGARLFLIYPEGNFVEAGAENAVFQSPGNKIMVCSDSIVRTFCSAMALRMRFGCSCVSFALDDESEQLSWHADDVHIYEAGLA